MRIVGRCFLDHLISSSSLSLSSHLNSLGAARRPMSRCAPHRRTARAPVQTPTCRARSNLARACVWSIVIDCALRRARPTCGKVFFLGGVVLFVHVRQAVGKHRHDVRAAKRPRLAALVEERVELDRIVLPACRRMPSETGARMRHPFALAHTFGHRTDVLVETGDHRNVAGPTLGRHARVRHAPRAARAQHVVQKWRVTRVLKELVGAKAVGCVAAGASESRKTRKPSSSPSSSSPPHRRQRRLVCSTLRPTTARCSSRAPLASWAPSR